MASPQEDSLKSLFSGDFESTEDMLDNAAKKGNVHDVKLLLEHNVPLSFNALNYASQNGHVGVVELLLKHGAQPGQFELKHSVLKNHPHVVELLLKHGAESTLEVFELACDKGYIEVMKQLIKYNGDIFFPCEALVHAICRNRVEIVECLLKRYSDGVSIHTAEMLERAARLGYTDIVRLLLEHGAIPTEKAFNAAVKHHHLETARLLRGHVTYRVSIRA